MSWKFYDTLGRLKTVSTAGGVDTFIELLDVPADYTGHSGKSVVVKQTEDGLEFVTISGGTGVTTFLGLTDTPDNYTTFSGKYIAVKSTEDGLEFVDAPTASGGATTFLQLTDTPDSYIGQSGKVPVVNIAENALEFVTISGITASGTAILVSKKIYDSTLSSDGAININNSDLSSDAGTFATYDKLDIYLYNARGTVADTIALLKLYYGTGGGALDTTDTNYYVRYMENAAANSEDSPRIALIPGANSTANLYGNIQITVYEPGGNKHKNAIAYSAARTSTTLNTLYFAATSWENTGTITRVGLTTHAGTFASGTRIVIVGHKFENTTATSSGSAYYQTIRDNGSNETQRSALNFIAGSGISLSITDDSVNNETDVTITASGETVYYQTVKRDNSAATQRPAISFQQGSNITLTVADSPGNNHTVVSIASTGREVLSADRTYYVRTDGSDSNNGLANTSGSAFATIQKAYNVATTLDLGGFTITIKLGNSGTWTAGLSAAVPLVGGNLIIEGDTTTPTNTVVSVTSGNCFSFSCPIVATVKHLKVQTTTSGSGITTSHSAALITVNTVFTGAIATYCFVANPGKISVGGAYTISGSQQAHYVATGGGVITFVSHTVTLTGTPAFSLAFAYVAELGSIQTAGMTYSGAATGTRYNVNMNGVIQTFGGGANYFPGNAAGTSATGGQYA